MMMVWISVDKKGQTRCVWPKYFLTGIFFESPTTRGAGGLDFSTIGGKKQRHGSSLIGASDTV